MTESPHRKTVALLLVAATVLTFVAIFSFWINRQAMNTDHWVDTSGKLLENEEVRTQLATYLVDQLYANVDVEAELKKVLPPQAAALAGPAAGGLRDLAQQLAERALGTARVQELWAKANRVAHEHLLKILDGGGSFVSTGEGEVTLQLGTLVGELAEEVGVPGDVREKLPEDAAELKVLDSNQLAASQKIAKVIRKLPVVLTILLILLYGGAIYLARGRRREAVRATGFGFIVAGVIVLLLRSIAGDNVTDSLAATASVKPAVEATWEIATSLLVTVAVSAIAFGVIVVIGTWLAGETAPATALRREAAPYFRERQVAMYGVAAAIWLALIAWAPVSAFRKPFGILLFAVLFAVGTELLRRQTLAEFPHQGHRPLGSSFREWWAARRGTSTSVAPAAGGGSGQLGDLERLNALRKEGALTDSEFEAQKQQLLGAP
jgi:Short C-terminal domain